MAVPGQDKSHESHANYVRIPCIVFFAVTPIFLFIRFYNRISRRTGLGWDDATILVSFVRPGSYSRIPSSVLMGSNHCLL